MKGVIMTIIGFAITFALMVSVIMPLAESTKSNGDTMNTRVETIGSKINELAGSK